MSSLKAAPPFQEANNSDMSVTPEVSHVEMWPYVASAAVSSLNHAVTAVRMLLSDIRHCFHAARRRRARGAVERLVEVRVVAHAPAEVLVEGEAP